MNEDVDDVVLDDMDDIVEDMKQGSRYIARSEGFNMILLLKFQIK